MFVAKAVDPTLALAARVLGALIFGWGVAGKLRHRQEFVGVVANYRLLPAALSWTAAWSVMLLEAFVCVSLATGWAALPGALCALGLLALFTAAMAINLARGRVEIDCGCFQSALRQQLSLALILRNLALLVLLLPALAAALPHSASQVSSGESGLQLLDGVGAGVTLFLLYQAIAQLLALRGPGTTGARGLR